MITITLTDNTIAITTNHMYKYDNHKHNNNNDNNNNILVEYYATCRSAARRYRYCEFMITRIRSVFKMSCLFLRPRPWQFEI